MEPQCDDPDSSSDKQNQTETKKSPLVASTSTHSAVTLHSQPTTNEGILRLNTSVEGRHKCAVTSKRLNQLRKIVEMAVREHKTFTIKGETVKKI